MPIEITQIAGMTLCRKNLKLTKTEKANTDSDLKPPKVEMYSRVKGVNKDKVR